MTQNISNSWTEVECQALFGEKWKELYDFYKSLETFNWFASCGKPSNYDDQVIRVYSFKDAKKLLPSGNNNLIEALTKIRRSYDKANQMGLLEWDAWVHARSDTRKQIVNLELKGVKRLAIMKASAWASLTGQEILVSFIPETPYHFRKMLPWYRDGFWPVTIRDSDNKLIVY